MHSLEAEYALTADELLDAVNVRFRLKVALEGAVAEVHMEKKIKALAGLEVERYEAHDIDNYPDFSIWLPGRQAVLFAECKNVRNRDEAYREGGRIIAYKVETQKTRAATADATSRYYAADRFHILGVCLGKKTGKWSDFLFARTIDLSRHAKYAGKLAVMQRVPLPGASDMAPWYADLAELLGHIDDPPCGPSTRPA